MKKLKFIILFFLASKLVTGQVEEIRFDQIPILDSLDYTYIRRVIQDREGFIWFFTENGLYKFDGNKITAYKPDPVKANTIGDGNLTNVIPKVDSRGNIWMLHRNNKSLELYDKKKDKFFQMDLRYLTPDTTGSYSKGAKDFLEDAQHNIWVATSYGLFMCSLSELYESMYTGEKPEFRKFVHDPADLNTLSSDNIIVLANDSMGNVLVGTSSGLDLLMNNTIKELKDQPAKPLIFRKAYPGARDTSDQSDLSIMKIYVDEYHNVWFATEIDTGPSVLHKIDNNEYAKFLNRDEQLLIKLHTVPYRRSDFDFLVAKGKIWIEPADVGVYVANLNDDQVPGPFFRYDLENSRLSGISVYSLMYDLAGNLWLTLRRNGADIVYNTTEAFSTIDKGGHRTTFGIFEDHEKRVWFGSQDGLSRFDRNSSELIRFKNDPGNPNSISSNWVINVIEDSDHHLWIATLNELNVIDLNQKDDNYHFIKYFNDPDDSTSIFPGGLNCLYLDENQDLWVGGFGGGLARVIKPSGNNPGSISNCTFENHYLDPYRKGSQFDINSITSNPFYESKNILWIGTTQGLYLFNKGEKKSIHLPLPTDKFGASSPNHVGSIYAKNNHTIWITTVGSGLGKIEIEEHERSTLPESEIGDRDSLININGEIFSFTTEWFTEKDGLVDNQILGIVEDDYGYLWLSTVRGISRFHPPSKEFKNYRETQDENFVYFSYHKNSSGEIFFGSGNNLIHFHPFTINTYIPPVYITDFSLFNEPVYPGEDSPLTVAIEYTEAIDLTYKQNYLSFEFAALNYNHPEYNRYKYRMIGFDPDTIYAGTTQTAEYPNLDPGKYTFWVTGSNNDGIWNKEGRSIDIIIHPPWYRTNLAYGSYVLLFILSLFGFIRWRTWSLEKDKRILEGQVKERTQEIEKQKEELQAINEELQYTLENLKHTQAQLVQSEKLASLGGLVAGVAHEINTPVGIGVTAVSSLMEDTQRIADLYRKEQISRKDFKEFLQTTNNSAKLIQKNLERTAQLVQSFKQVSTDQATEEQREFLFKAYLEDVIRSLYPKFKNRNIEIKIDCDEKLKIDSFPGIFAQIFTNLVLNSITHGFREDREGVIDVIVKKENSNLNIEYKDNGAGIPEEILPKIFDPFFTTDQSKGTGLGLNIVYNLVTQKLGGTIECESVEGEGVVFGIVIPVSSEQ